MFELALLMMVLVLRLKLAFHMKISQNSATKFLMQNKFFLIIETQKLQNRKIKTKRRENNFYFIVSVHQNFFYPIINPLSRPRNSFSCLFSCHLQDRKIEKMSHF